MDLYLCPRVLKKRVNVTSERINTSNTKDKKREQPKRLWSLLPDMHVFYLASLSLTDNESKPKNGPIIVIGHVEIHKDRKPEDLITYPPEMGLSPKIRKFEGANN